jgi:diguanylate cyclase (GGDEF)-like protein
MTSWNRRTGIQILIAEDSSTQAEHLAVILENHGYEVTVAPDGEQALAIVRERAPALLISDVVMPKMDGYELCCAIKHDPELHQLPIILVTTLSDPADVLRGLECGADNFIRKPFDERYLLSRIDYLLMNKELRTHQKTQIGLEIDLRGTRYFINSDRQQILDLLISTYEQAVDLNTELSERERDLVASNEMLDSLYHIADELNQAVTKQDVLDRGINRVMQLPGVHAAWIALTDSTAGALKVAAVANLPFALGSEHTPANCRCLTELLTNKRISAFNVYDCKRLSPSGASEPGLQCHATIPLAISTGNRFGVMNLVSPDEVGFDEAQLQLFTGIGNQLAVALERAELHENLERLVEERTLQVKRLNRLYGVLSGINTTIVRTRSHTELFGEVCRIAIDVGKFAFVWIGTSDEAGLNIDQITCASATGITPPAAELARSVAQVERSGMLIKALQQGKPFVRNNITNDEQQVDIWTRDYQSTAVLPLVRDGSLAGVCVLYVAEPDAFTDRPEIELLTEIAGDIGFALDYQEKDHRLNYLAYYDSLTGLANRAMFADHLNAAMRKNAHKERSIVIGILNLNRFKVINESLGHVTGDSLLKTVGKRLSHAIGDDGMVARITGDEFGVLLPDFSRIKNTNQILALMKECFNLPFMIAEHEIFINASIGFTFYPGDGNSVEELMQNAGAAMYRAKADGGSSFKFYEPEMTAQARDRLSMENDLRRALERHEFVLHYQPIVNAANGQITGVEALARWISPERGLVSPVNFIPIAEETLLIIDLGAWVLEEACRQLTTGWGGIADTLRLSVNVSTRQFLLGNFYDLVMDIVDRTGIDTTRLTLEITESHLMINIDEMVATMRKLGKLGIRFSIDDFGTGYSSLAYLKNLPIANLKIDRTFIKNLPDNTDDVAIVKTIISMGHALNQRVIAEGVETREQLEFLQANGCNAIQGYYFSRPVPADELAQLLISGKNLPGGQPI